MKKLIPLLALVLLQVPVQAQQVNEFEQCSRTRETYVPGYYDDYGNYQQGRVETETYRVPCPNTNRKVRVACNPARTTLGGLLGGGIAAAVSKKDAYGWAIPLGAVLGTGASQINCY